WSPRAARSATAAGAPRREEPRAPQPGSTAPVPGRGRAQCAARRPRPGSADPRGHGASCARACLIARTRRPAACQDVGARRRRLRKSGGAPMPDLDPDLARWITAPGDDPQNPLLRTRLTLDSPPVSARLLVTGLGAFRAFLNGAPAPASRLDPGLTDARARVPVCEVEVTELLGTGENVLAIALGRGFHNMATPNEWRWDQAPWRGPVRAWAHMEVTCTDESTVSVTTGDGWRTRPGPVTFD